MSTYPNRETLFSVYINTDEKEWESVMGQYAVEGVDHPTPLYYLSLDPNLQGNFVIGESYDDSLALSGDFATQESLTVALPQRLLANPTIQGCWNQIYWKLAHCYRGETDFNRPIHLYLYEVDKTNTVVIDNNALVHEHLVHNAHTSETCAVFGLPQLKLVQQLVVKNTLNYPDERCTYYVPFNDPKYNPRLLSTTLEIVATVNK